MPETEIDVNLTEILNSDLNQSDISMNSDNISLKEEELSDLKAIDKAALHLKVRLAELVQQQYNLNEQVDKAIAALNAKQDEYLVEVRKLASDHGIEVDNPEKGRWNFNVYTGVFSKL